MTQEEKELLLKDLCARLPYGVHLFTNSKHHIRMLTISNDIDYDEQYWINGLYDVDEVKPYLRPMSSMTEEEEEELRLLKNQLVNCNENNDEKFYHIINEIHNLYLSHHIDFMGLIPKGLAIEVTESNNPYESKDS